jgi:hypothetical protein
MASGVDIYLGRIWDLFPLACLSHDSKAGIEINILSNEVGKPEKLPSP